MKYHICPLYNTIKLFSMIQYLHIYMYINRSQNQVRDHVLRTKKKLVHRHGSHGFGSWGALLVIDSDGVEDRTSYSR